VVRFISIIVTPFDRIFPDGNNPPVSWLNYIAKKRFGRKSRGETFPAHKYSPSGRSKGFKNINSREVNTR
jgi:hypothetical protein